MVNIAARREMAVLEKMEVLKEMVERSLADITRAREMEEMIAFDSLHIRF